MVFNLYFMYIAVNRHLICASLYTFKNVTLKKIVRNGIAGSKGMTTL